MVEKRWEGERRGTVDIERAEQQRVFQKEFGFDWFVHFRIMTMNNVHLKMRINRVSF